jgi:hypothetical protein
MDKGKDKDSKERVALKSSYLFYAVGVVLTASSLPSFLRLQEVQGFRSGLREERKIAGIRQEEESKLALQMAELGQRGVLRSGEPGGMEVPLRVGMVPVDPATMKPFSPGTVVLSKHRTVGRVGDGGTIAQILTVSESDQAEYLALLKRLEESRTSAGINGRPLQQGSVEDFLRSRPR